MISLHLSLDTNAPLPLPHDDKLLKVMPPSSQWQQKTSTDAKRAKIKDPLINQDRELTYMQNWSGGQKCARLYTYHLRPPTRRHCSRSCPWRLCKNECPCLYLPHRNIKSPDAANHVSNPTTHKNCKIIFRNHIQPTPNNQAFVFKLKKKLVGEWFLGPAGNQ